MKNKTFLTYAKKKSINDENEVILNKKYQKVRDQCHYT